MSNVYVVAMKAGSRLITLGNRDNHKNCSPIPRCVPRSYFHLTGKKRVHPQYMRPVQLAAHQRIPCCLRCVVIQGYRFDSVAILRIPRRQATDLSQVPVCAVSRSVNVREVTRRYHIISPRLRNLRHQLIAPWRLPLLHRVLYHQAQQFRRHAIGVARIICHCHNRQIDTSSHCHGRQWNGAGSVIVGCDKSTRHRNGRRSATRIEWR